jgi:gamma-glutamylputrescine oxidase
MQSYYQASADRVPPRPALKSQQRCKIAIVGAGFAGLYTALGLAERGQEDIVLLEAEQVGFGASGRNGGFVFGGFSLGEQSLIDRLGAERARFWYQQTTASVNLIRQRIARYQIDCDLVDQGVLWANWFADDQVLKQRQKLLAEYFDTHWQWLDRDQLRQQLRSNRYSAALFERNAMHLHPLKYCRGLLQACESLGVRCFEQSPVRSVEKQADGFVLNTDHGSLVAEQVVIACGGYLGRLVPQLATALMPIATYVMATEALGASLRDYINTEAAIYDTRFAFDYYRALPDTRILWGGRISVRDREPQQVAALLKRDLLKVFPELRDTKIDYAWSGLMSYARHEMPQIGRLPNGLWYAQAFGGHGLAPTCVAGEALADGISGRDSRYLELAPFGLQHTFGVLGKAAAQATYSWLQLKDRWKDR